MCSELYIEFKEFILYSKKNLRVEGIRPVL